MGWKCDYCDTYNESGTVECYVCGHERSPESILEEKKIKHDEYIKRLAKKTENTIHIICKSLFIGGISLSLIALTSFVITMIFTQNADGIAYFTAIIFRQAGKRMASIFNPDSGYGFSLIIKNAIPSKLGEWLISDIEAVWKTVSTKVQAISEQVWAPAAQYIYHRVESFFSSF